MNNCKWLVCKSISNWHHVLELDNYDNINPKDLYVYYKECLKESLKGTTWCYTLGMSIKAIYILI